MKAKVDIAAWALGPASAELLHDTGEQLKDYYDSYDAAQNPGRLGRSVSIVFDGWVADNCYESRDLKLRWCRNFPDYTMFVELAGPSEFVNDALRILQPVTQASP